MSDVYLLRASLRDYVLLWAVTMVIIAVHELAHGYTCKYFGGKVHEIGAMLFYFELAFFCNVNDAWTFPELKARLWVTAAGSWIEMVVASLAAIVWWIAAPGTFLSDVGAGGLPGRRARRGAGEPQSRCIPLDGYYALSDWLEVPNLRQRAFAHLAWTIQEPVARPGPADAAGRRAGAADLPALRHARHRLHRDDLPRRRRDRLRLARRGSSGRSASPRSWSWSSGSRPARSAGTCGRPWPMRGGSCGRGGRPAAGCGGSSTALGGLASCVAVAGLAPWPITVTGPFVVSPAASGILVAPDSGVVVEVLVSEGSRVGAGRPLALIRNLELEREAGGDRRWRWTRWRCARRRRGRRGGRATWRASRLRRGPRRPGSPGCRTGSGRS